jgi:hypothetical protein
MPVTTHNKRVGECVETDATLIVVGLSFFFVDEDRGGVAALPWWPSLFQRVRLHSFFLFPNKFSWRLSRSKPKQGRIAATSVFISNGVS